MYELFKVNHPNFKVSYELYRKESTPRINSVLIRRNVMYGARQRKVEWARQEYRKDGETNVTGTEKLTVAADLQKVIMLPEQTCSKKLSLLQGSLHSMNHLSL
ncbi:hypothetical protein JTB14_011706 [Gonioctena quinquepunctata]|nr:hypothetical protein JTB14_011706 [Gonioctena quinquepunctata]